MGQVVFFNGPLVKSRKGQMGDGKLFMGSFRLVGIVVVVVIGGT